MDTQLAMLEYFGLFESCSYIDIPLTIWPEKYRYLLDTILPLLVQRMFNLLSAYLLKFTQV